MNKKRDDVGERTGAARATRATRPREKAPDGTAYLTAAEHLTKELARVRANFGMDVVLAPRSLAAAWTSPTAVMEEDEAEFVDAVADCLGVGLPLGAVLDCWDNGELAYDGGDEPGAADDEPSLLVIPPPARHGSGRRLYVR